MAKPGDENYKAHLGAALDKLVKRKVEDFEFGYVEGKDMNATTAEHGQYHQFRNLQLRRADWTSGRTQPRRIQAHS